MGPSLDFPESRARGKPSVREVSQPPLVWSRAGKAGKEEVHYQGHCCGQGARVSTGGGVPRRAQNASSNVPPDGRLLSPLAEDCPWGVITPPALQVVVVWEPLPGPGFKAESCVLHACRGML